MQKFKLIDSKIIKNPSISISNQRGCFLYDFKGAGLSINQITKWLHGKIMDIYEFEGRFTSSKKCPWCGKSFDDPSHLGTHNKTLQDIETIKLSNQLYSLLLSYLRNNNYDALHFLMHRECQYCINPIRKGRKGMCAIPESSRNKPRSIKALGLEYSNFNVASYGPNVVALIYKRRPLWR